ncbi:MAG: N-acetyltransferase [Bacteroidia bacterium]|nr:N-acetyltransferase [Bacteroidia bacterium]
MTYYAHPTATIDEGAEIGTDTKVWHYSHVMAGAKIGAGCSLGQNVFIANTVVIGNGVKIQNNVSIYDGVTCEDEVFIGPSVVFTNIKNPRSAIPRKDQYLPTVVRKGASIGANVTIVCGVELGAFCFIGAGAVVTKHVANYALVMGSPARHIGWMSEYGHRLHFDQEGLAKCPENGDLYRLMNGKVQIV